MVNGWDNQEHHRLMRTHQCPKNPRKKLTHNNIHIKSYLDIYPPGGDKIVQARTSYYAKFLMFEIMEYYLNCTTTTFNTENPSQLEKTIVIHVSWYGSNS